MNLNFDPALNFNDPFNHINRLPTGAALNLQDVFHALAEIKQGVARIENRLPGGHPFAQPHPVPMFPFLTGLRPQRGLEGQQWPQTLHNPFHNMHPIVAQPKPRRMRDANRNTSPCYACQVRKKKCNRQIESPNLCEWCAHIGLNACHPPPARFTQDPANRVYQEASNLGRWSAGQSKLTTLARAPTVSVAMLDNTDTKERADNAHDGSENTQGLSCAVEFGQPNVKKEVSSWDEGVLIPSI